MKKKDPSCGVELTDLKIQRYAFHITIVSIASDCSHKAI
jgi:hypothetical protein